MQMEPLFASRFFTPAFNTAIFDGPLRIYFAQSHEAVGLEAYYELKEALGIRERGVAPSGVCRNLYVLIYPDQAGMDACFRNSHGGVATAKLGSDVVVAMSTLDLAKGFWQEVAKLVQPKIMEPALVANLQ